MKLQLQQDAQLADFARQPKWRVEDGRARRGGDLLLDYGSPGRIQNGPSTVESS